MGRFTVVRGGLNLSRNYSVSIGRRGWVDSLFGRKTGGQPPELTTKTSAATGDVSPSDVVKGLVETYIPDHTGHWEAAPLHNLEAKLQILLSCETHFQRSIPSTELGSILTAGDILKHLALTAPPSLTPPPSLFPDMPGDSLPANLSVQTPTSVKRREKRVPFQNYSTPRHTRRKWQNKS